MHGLSSVGKHTRHPPVLTTLLGCAGCTDALWMQSRLLHNHQPRCTHNAAGFYYVHLGSGFFRFHCVECRFLRVLAGLHWIVRSGFVWFPAGNSATILNPPILPKVKQIAFIKVFHGAFFNTSLMFPCIKAGTVIGPLGNNVIVVLLKKLKLLHLTEAIFFNSPCIFCTDSIFGSNFLKRLTLKPMPTDNTGLFSCKMP